jgi:hypothetical protein
MNIDEMTIKQVREIATIINGVSGSNVRNLYSQYIGKYVIVRSRNEGINAGTVVDIDDTGVVIKDARRLWRHMPKDRSMSWYEGVATSGLGDGSRVSNTVSQKVICEDYSLTICTNEAEESIRGAESNEQS